jgi:hypothetical protein
MSKIGVYNANPISLSDGGQTTDVQVDSSGFQKVTNGTLNAGERNVDSATNSYVVTRDEANLTIIGLTTAITIGGGAAGDTHLIGLHITTALTGTCVITGFGDSAGAATSLTLPIGSVGFKDFRGAINNIGALTVTCSTAGDDNFVAVLWRPV